MPTSPTCPARTLHLVRRFPSRICCYLLLSFILPPLYAQDSAGDKESAQPPIPPGRLIKIGEEPRTIDPITLVPPKLAKLVKARFVESPVRDVITWLQTEQKLNVVVNTKALTKSGIYQNELVSEQLNDEPLYLLLDRLRTIELGWRFDNDRLLISTKAEVDSQMSTVTYNLGDLLDQNFDGERLRRSIESTTNDSKQGSYVVLGDVLFVTNNEGMHRAVAGLLAAYRNPARRTFVDDLPTHEAIRNALRQTVSIRFRELPLSEAVKELSSLAKIDVRIDRAALKAANVRERSPVTLEVNEQRLDAALSGLLADLELTWTIQDGVLWITTTAGAVSQPKTAVFDVRDLCADDDESFALRDTLRTHLRDWSKGKGKISFARSGLMVVRAPESQLDEAFAMLETYRTALLASKPRPKKEGPNPKEVVTRYYKIRDEVAPELMKSLVANVLPETWQSTQRPSASGTIKRHPSVSFAVEDGSERITFVPSSVLVIQHTRETHEKIVDYIQKILHGDVSEIEDQDFDRAPIGSGGMLGGMGGGGMGGMGGGMGGGLPSAEEAEDSFGSDSDRASEMMEKQMERMKQIMRAMESGGDGPNRPRRKGGFGGGMFQSSPEK